MKWKRKQPKSENSSYLLLSELPESDSNLLKYAYQDWVLLNHRSPTHQTVTNWPTDHLLLTHRRIDHLPTDPQTPNHQLTLK